MTFEKLENLNDKVVVIAGGCGQVGYAAAQSLSRLGAKIIVLVRRDLDAAQEKMNQLPNNHLGHRAILASVIDTVSIKNAVSDIKEFEGKCDILINAAGVSKTRNTDTKNITDEIFDETISTNFKGPLITIREFVDLLNCTGDGLIINISSTASIRPRNNILYGASKAAVNTLTQGFARSLGPNIRVVGIAPGFLTYPTSGASPRTPDEESAVINWSALKRITTGEDIANAIESVALTMRFITGQTIVIDGGVII
jgi:NAD(P)-dependent dehydrogenase (short-subunit alcohol dehydrogenase family)